MKMKLVDNFNAGVDFESLYHPDVAVKFCVLLALKYAYGHDLRISRKKLIKLVTSIWWSKISKTDKTPGDRKIRNTVRDLRRSGALIVSTGGTKGGYWIPKTLTELLFFVTQELVARALDLLFTASRMVAAARRKFGGQIPLGGEEHIWENKVRIGLQEVLPFL